MRRQMKNKERRGKVQTIKELLGDLGKVAVELRRYVPCLRTLRHDGFFSPFSPKVDVTQPRCGPRFRWNTDCWFPILAPPTRTRRRRRRLKREILATRRLTYANALVKTCSREFAIGILSWTKSSVPVSLSHSRVTTVSINRKNSSTRWHQSC